MGILNRDVLRLKWDIGIFRSDWCFPVVYRTKQKSFESLEHISVFLAVPPSPSNI